MQENQDKYISKARLRHDSLGEEVKLPQGLGMPFDELIPRTWSALWTGVVAVALENSFHCISSYRPDSEFTQFAQDSAIAPSIFGRQF